MDAGDGNNRGGSQAADWGVSPVLRGYIVMAGLLMAAPLARAQQPAPPGMSLAEAAAHRFPQPVRVGDLLHRAVLQPLESQPRLGSVQNVVRRADGRVDIIVKYDVALWIFTRPIAVPVEAMTLLGAAMEIVDFTPDQLGSFKTDDGAGATPLPHDSIIQVGLARPSH